MKPYYEQDGVTIYNADCLEILRANLVEASLVVTSPPYNLVRRNSGSGANSIHRDGLWKKLTTEWYEDELSEDEYRMWQREVIKECLAVAPCMAYNHKVRYQQKRHGTTFHPMEWINPAQLWSEIVWDQGGGVALNCRRPVPADERVYILGKPKAWHDLGYTSVWRIPTVAQGFDHPCPFPEELPRRVIAMFTDAGDTVLDPFMGVGTTLVAAKRMGRKAVGIEREEKYCEIAAKRLAQGALPMEFSA